MMWMSTLRSTSMNTARTSDTPVNHAKRREIQPKPVLTPVTTGFGVTGDVARGAVFE